MDDGFADIVPLPTGYDPEADQAPIVAERNHECFHREVGINTDARKLFCRRCDAEVDPLIWIERLARDWQHYQNRIDQAQTRARHAEEETERRIKETQRARPKVPMPVVRRLTRIGRSVGRAQTELAEASAALIELSAAGSALLPDHHLAEAAAHIARARASFQKLARDHAKNDSRLPR